MLIIDEFLSKNQFKELQNKVLSRGFPWFYIEHVSLPPEDSKLINDTLAKETDGFYHMLFDRNEDITSFADILFENLYLEIEKRLGYSKRKLIRARLSMKMPKVGFETKNYNLPHVDYYFSHDTLLFYLNTSDGDTRMFEQEFNGDFENTENFTIEKLITPLENRIVLFDGLKYHTASNPFNTARRIVLNLNYEKI